MTSKTKLKMRKFNNLQRQVRTIEEMKPEEHKYIKELLRKIKMKTFQQLQEGVYDPNIFNAIFLAWVW